ncbi:hypothetical protein IFM12276_07160 [Nocardia sputorum]|uniref:Uncharacterized protein n=1 Tax=Nocardia sputorum TaxID=2984338 RepID=A0ABM8CSN8_9NOCA|nr:hypothetical protein IFM12276_07160 [Nocardia sputorum]
MPSALAPVVAVAPVVPVGSSPVRVGLPVAVPGLIIEVTMPVMLAIPVLALSPALSSPPQPAETSPAATSTAVNPAVRRAKWCMSILSLWATGTPRTP